MAKEGKKIRAKIAPFIFAFVIIAGACLLLYPVVSDYLNSKNQSKAIAGYNQIVEDMDEENYDEEFQKARHYNDELNKLQDAIYFPDKVEGYDDILNVDKNGIMAFVSIPKISVNLPIYHGTSDAVLNGAVGHMKGTSLPIGGENTHAVIAGHRGLTSAGLFTDLDKIEIGDKFSITVLDKVLEYTVDQIVVVLPEEVEELEVVSGEDYVTLQTCTPYGVNSHRLLVRGKRTGTSVIDKEDERVVIQPEIIDTVTNTRNFIPIIIAASILSVTAAIIIIKKIKNTKKK